MNTRILTLLLIVVLCFGCQKDEVIAEEQTATTQQTPTLTRVYGETIRNNTKLSEKLEQFSKVKGSEGNNLLRNVYDADNDFTVDTESAMFIENGDYHSYTFSVYTNDNTYTENLFLSYNIITDSYHAYRTTYDLSDYERELALEGMQPLDISENLIAIEPIDFNELSVLGKSDNDENIISVGGECYSVTLGKTSIFGPEMDALIFTPIDCPDPQSSNEPQFVNVQDGGGFVVNIIVVNNHSNNTSQHWETDDWAAAGGGSFSFVNNQLVYFPNDNTVPTVNHPQEVLRMLEVNSILDPDHVAISSWVSDHNNRAEVNDLYDYLDEHTDRHGIDPEAKAFVEEIILLANQEVNQDDAENLIALTMLIEESGDELFTDEFSIKLFNHVDLNLSSLPPDLSPNLLGIKVFLNYHKLRQLNPEWSRGRCIWYATKDIIHISLDVFGLIPVVGEVADLTNGLIYAIEGDNLNATLSVTSAIPFVGWGSTATKYAIKVTNTISNQTTKLVWKITAAGVEFGSRSQLRKVLGLLPGNPNQAHHIVPWSLRGKEIVQLAARSDFAFHMNDIMNGIEVAAWRNQPNHDFYN
ncbi:MAG: hypothetical protein AAF688_04110, partial [Bacteroidota bacterium]